MATTDVSKQVIRLLEKLSCSTHSPPSDQATSTKKTSLRDKVGDARLYEFAEHKFLGDSITLQGRTGSTFVIRSNLNLTYGQINGLAGDFFGTLKPICLGTTDEDRLDRFRQAYYTLVEEIQMRLIFWKLCRMKSTVSTRQNNSKN